MPRHHSPWKQDALLHDFDPEKRVLRVLFISPDGHLASVTYRLCPLCGVTMDEQPTGSETGHRLLCGICGLVLC